MKRKLLYRPEALADLSDTETYTRFTWASEQAKCYIAALVSDIKLLRVSALQNPPYESVYLGLRRKRSGMHHVYYLTSGDIVEVLKIIHVQRDPGTHLRVETWRDEA